MVVLFFQSVIVSILYITFLIWSFFFREQFRVLKKGGKIYIATHSSEDIGNQTLARYFPTLTIAEISRLHKINSILDNLLKAGFQNIMVYGLSEDFVLSEADLLLFSNKTLSGLHDLDETDFNIGLSKMKDDIKQKIGIGNHSYTIVNATK